VVIEAKAVTRDELPDFLAERLGRQKQRASVETLEWLADRVEGNLLAASRKSKSSRSSCPRARSRSTRSAAPSPTSRASSATPSSKAIHGADSSRVARAVASLKAEGEPLPLLLWTLAEELRLVMSIVAGERPRRYLPPDRSAALARTAKRHNAKSFHRELLRAHRIDRMIKGVETGDPWESLLELALGIAGRPVMMSTPA
jgi:DNA polymerase-3 subunit delta